MLLTDASRKEGKEDDMLSNCVSGPLSQRSQSIVTKVSEQGKKRNSIIYKNK